MFSCVFIHYLTFWLCKHLYLLSPHRASYLQSEQQLARIQKPTLSKNGAKLVSLQRHRPLFSWHEDQHTAGLFTTVDLLD